MNSIGEFQVGISVGGVKQRIYQKDGRYFVSGEPGQAYAIEVYNPKGQRIEVLESVDGRNVLQDEPASFSNRGMIVSAHSLWRNAGWRIDDEHVREFVFGSPSASIAAQATGSAAGTGVIGIAIFTERHREWVYKSSEGPSYRFTGNDLFADVQLRSLTSSYNASAAAASDLGTGMGEAKADHVGHTTFERSSSAPWFQVEIQYRTQAWLVEHGIVQNEPTFPSAWPGGTTGYEKYVK